MALALLAAGIAVPGLAVGRSSAGVVTASVRVARTAAGSVGYREVGRGSPLLLITGLGASMDDWAPSFVDALAAEHRVVIFDNAGVGRTSSLGARLTITAMANQTSALISSLRLGHPAVLGWSLGGMVAQALAVLHPSEVSRLILAATQSGTGNALPVPRAAAKAVNSSNPAQTLSVLFPPGQSAAKAAYVKGILNYPGYYQASDAVKTLQNAALAQWLAGRQPAGRNVTDLRLPTLVADGTNDALDPVRNDRMLASLIRGAQLALYPDAGHAFWFQDEAQFVARIDRFLR
ncbi:MAG: alpha/beta fold hydrolase [Solirubrobacteraceae bacterium]